MNGKFRIIGRSDGKTLVEMANGDRIKVTDEELKALKATGELPKAPDTSPKPNATIADRVKALEDRLAAMEARLPQEDAEDETEDPKADRVKALGRTKKADLVAIAEGHGLTLASDATNASIAEAIIAHEFPES